MSFGGRSLRKDINLRMVPLRSHGIAGLYHNCLISIATTIVRLLLCELAGLLLSNLVVHMRFNIIFT